MADDHDVIIRRSGAGGGTLAHRLAPFGQAGADSRAGRYWLPREIENWDATAVFVTTGTCPRGR